MFEMQISSKFPNLQPRAAIEFQTQAQSTTQSENVDLKVGDAEEGKIVGEPTREQRELLEERANALFESLNTGLALKFHERSGEWYAVVENKLTREIVKEVPPKYILDLHAKLKEMVGFFLDQKI